MTILSFRFMGVRTPDQIGPEIEAMAQNPAGGSWLLWTRTDARDAALACRLALEAESVPSGLYNITGAEVVLSTPTLRPANRNSGQFAGQCLTPQLRQSQSSFWIQPALYLVRIAASRALSSPDRFS